MLTIETPEKTVYIFSVLVQPQMLRESVDALVKQAVVSRQPAFEAAEILHPNDWPDLYRTAFRKLNDFIRSEGMKVINFDVGTGILTVQSEDKLRTNERAMRLFAFNTADIRQAAEG